MSEVETGALGPGRIESRELEQEMRSSFLDYAMSVIVSRALPDVRDGLKPVHRRVLYGMHEAGLQPNRPYKKSASTVGDVMANYHPHGDSAIYDTLVRMAQPFSLRYPLVDGQGNFGSIDDDPAAAMRYTEARLVADRDRAPARHRREHRRLRAELRRVAPPAVGPAVALPEPARQRLDRNRGRAWRRTCRRTTSARRSTRSIAMIDDPEISVEGLMKHVKGPDFPTGAIVVGRSGIRDAYRTGRGRIVMRARAHIEELRGGRSAIVVTELPYGVKKGGDTGVIVKIADLVRDKVLTEVSDLADHSDRTGMRIQIELKRDAIPQVALNKLFKHTPLQSTFGYNAVALVDGVPRTLSLLELVRHYLEFQREVVTRRSKDELRKAEARAHVLEGYLIALDNIDAIVALIRAAADRDEARDAADGAVRALARSRRRRSSTCGSRASPASRARRSRTSTTTCRSGSPSCATILGDQAKIDGAHPRRAARDQADLRPQRRPPHRDRRRRGGARARGPDRRGGHGHRDHALRLHQAATRDRRTASSGAAASA